MRFFIMPKMSVLIVFIFLFSMLGCSSSSSNGKNSNNNGSPDSVTEKSFQESLDNFNIGLDATVLNMEHLIDSIVGLNQAIAQDDDDEIDIYSNYLDEDVTYLMESLEIMDWMEADIQAAIGSESIEKAIGITLLGAGLVIGGLYSFAQYCKGKSDEVSKARIKKDQDQVDVGNGVPGAVENYRESKRKIGELGEDLIRELTTKITTDLILSPINPTSATGLILKEAAGNTFQEGLKVISTTKQCKNGYEAPGCVIGISDTNQSGEAIVAGSDSTTIVVGGKDVSRIVIKDENLPPGTYKEVTRESIPTKDAKPDNIAANDSGDYDAGDNDPVDTSPSLTVSSAVADEDEGSITYWVAAAVGGVKGATNVTLEVQNASTNNATKTINANATITWSVRVLANNAVVTVHRSDTNERQSISLPGKGKPATDFDGLYYGYYINTWHDEDIIWCIGFDGGDDVEVTVSGSTLGAAATGTVTVDPNNPDRATVSGTAYDIPFNGTIENDVMSGTYTTTDGRCGGTFTLYKQNN